MIFQIFNKIVSWVLGWKKSFFCHDLDQVTNHQSRNTPRISSKISRVGKEVESNTVLPSACIDKKYKRSVCCFTADVDAPLHFSEYEYLQLFQKKNSLKYGGIPLCIGSNQVSIIKQTDAVYCEEEKCWFWPFKQEANLDEIFPFLPKVYQMHENILVPNLVPEPLWGENLRKYLSKKDWDFLRKHTYTQSGYRCSICGGKGERWPVECDEIWDYQPLEDGRWISVLIGLRALCPRCHRVNHLGKANVDGKYDETVRHMAYINGWSLSHANRIAKESFITFEERSKKTWLLGYENECDWDPAIEKILKAFFCEVKAP